MIAPEREIAHDVARRALLVAPGAVALGALGWGADGALSVGYGLFVVVANLLLAAALLTWAADHGLEFIPLATLGGFGVRVTMVCVAVLAVVDASWIAPVPLGLTLIGGHLGLLGWEVRHVSATLAFPGLKPVLGQE